MRPEMDYFAFRVTRARFARGARAGTTQKVNATRAAFLVAGLGMAAWAPLVPYVKSRLAVDDGTLGLLLLCLGGGSVGCMPLCNRLIKKFGCRRMVCVGATLFSVALPLMAIMPTVPTMAMSLLLFGIGMGLLDVSMNVNALLVERESGQQLMSGFHGLYSVGGIVGSVFASSLLTIGARPLVVAFFVLFVVGGILYTFFPNLMTRGKASEPGSRLVFPHGVVILMGMMCLCVFLVEGAMLDWSAIFLTSTKDYPKELAGFGYTAFAITMAAGRLVGDRLSRRYGAGRMVLAGCACGATGIAVALFAPSGALAMFGYAIVGIGCSNVVPLLFSAAGKQKAMDPGAAISALTTLGYGGVLAGPAAIGVVSHAIGLSASFGLLAFLLALAAIGSRVALR